MNHGLLANAAISLFGHLFFMVPLVWVVIFIEAFIIRKKLHSSFGKAFGASTLANLASTFIGIPITWFLVSFLGAFVFSFLYNPNSHTNNHSVYYLLRLMFGGVSIPHTPAWVAILATSFLLIPYYYMSVWIEHSLLKAAFKQLHSNELKNTAVFMNRVTYIFLFILMLVFSAAVTGIDYFS